ncbi:hypothetical protein CI807_11765 [Pseudomonas sp. NS1(2017)]|nr:hypothetical protein CI807_11765 [Pseudomonas sp. NS1(2017)]
MLAKIANDNAGILNVRGVWKCFASKLAPTGDRDVSSDRDKNKSETTNLRSSDPNRFKEKHP